MRHILTGYDHLLFLAGLLVVVRRWRDVFQTITAFTVAHSITLALATTGMVNAPSRVVEMLIAASVVYVGLENLFRSEQLRRLAEMPGKVFDAVDVDPDGVSRSVAYPQVVDHALTKSSHGKLLSEAKCSFGDKHYALLKGAFCYAEA